jgi:2-dehydro-3-deoxyphosphogluconate aldolase/(4S)-4-hydroxy-2-oxoglutarate aldolase
MEHILKQRLVCVAVVDHPDDAVPLAQALMAGGLNLIEVTFRTEGAAEAIRRIRRTLPEMTVGAGTVLTPYQAAQAAEAGAQFLVAPGLDEAVLAAALARGVPYIPGVLTPTEIGGR